MKGQLSPFSPGQPVAAGCFVGREKEAERLHRKVRAAQSGRLQTAFLVGERGIGKSSLVAFVRTLAEREYNVLTLCAFLGGVTSPEEVVRRVLARLVKDSLGKRWHENVKAFLGDHIKQVGSSMEFAAPLDKLHTLMSDFAPAVRNLAENMREDRMGVLLILDDVDGLATSSEFANWLKSLVDEIATASRPTPLFLIIVGLEECRSALIQSQPSLVRVFDIIEIKEWSPEETREFFRTAFAEVGMTVDDDALNLLGEYAGGLPVLAHEIGDAVFVLDTDDRIDLNDAVEGVRSAADIVARKYLEPLVLQSIRGRKYTSLIRKIDTDTLVHHEMLRTLDEAEREVFDGFLHEMVELCVLIPDPDAGPGAYKFANRLHYLCFRLQAAKSGGAPQ